MRGVLSIAVPQTGESVDELGQAHFRTIMWSRDDDDTPFGTRGDAPRHTACIMPTDMDPDTVRVHFSHHAYRMQRAGGVSRYVGEIVAALAATGVDADVAAYLHANIFARADGRGVFIGGRSGRRARQAVSLAGDAIAEWVSPSRRTCDVYHYSYYPQWISAQRGITAVTVYDMIHERYPADFDFADRTAALKRRVCGVADVIFAISEATKADVVEFLDLDPDRVRVAPLGAPRLPLVPSIEPDRATFLYVGDRKRRYKNFRCAVDAMSAASRIVDDIELLCVGGGPFTAAELEFMEESGVRSLVRGVDAQDDELASLYARAVALVVPSWCEGFSLPVLEAMTQGCPVLCSTADALVEVTAGAAWLFDPKGADELASGMVALAADSGGRRRLSESGRRRALDFSWETCASTTYRGYLDAGARRL